MVSYRERLEIIADILHVAKVNAKKTQIMYQANLSYKVMQKYLGEILAASLLCFEEDKRCYLLTDKGRAFLDTYHKYSRNKKYMRRSLTEANNNKEVLERLCSGRDSRP